jgi:hypothetical protein
MNMAGLSKEQKQQMYEQGYVHIRGGVPQHLVNDALKAINHSLGNGIPVEKVDQFRSQSFCPELQSDPVILNLFHQSQAPELLQSVIDLDLVHPVRGGQIALRFPNRDSEPRQARPHLDGMHSPLNGVPKGTIHNFTALVGVLLSDLPNRHAGNFTVWPGSHLLYEQYFKEHGAESLLNGLPPVQLPEPVQVTGNAGDLIIAHYMLGHGVTPNISPHIRYAVFFRIKHKAIQEHNWQQSMENIWLHWPGMAENIPHAE